MVRHVTLVTSKRELLHKREIMPSPSSPAVNQAA